VTVRQSAVEPVQDGRTYIELINGPSLYQFKGRLPRCLIDGADRGSIRMLAEIAMRRAQRPCALFIQPSLWSVGIAICLRAAAATCASSRPSCAGNSRNTSPRQLRQRSGIDTS
jgi:hypothetical protein